ncbi:MAG: hypothetical protein ACEPOW_05820 [Bacteroidales bacterium]
METPERKIKLQNLNIYSGIDHLYLYKGDHKLFKVEGDERKLVEDCVEAIKVSETIGEVYAKVKDALEDDEEFFLQILEWLDENEVVTLEKSEEEVNWEEKTKETVLVASSITEEEAKNIIEVLNGKGRNLKLSKFINFRENQTVELPENADVVVLFSPIFENYEKVYKINAEAYSKGIPLLHIGMEQNTVTLGPFVNPKFKTPCLSCYLKRKITNLANPTDFVRFMEIPDKKSLSELRISDMKYYDLMLSHLSLELEKVFLYDGLFSQLMNHSILIDPVGLCIEKSTIIKISDCEVCNSSSHYYPY